MVPAPSILRTKTPSMSHLPPSFLFLSPGSLSRGLQRPGCFRSAGPHGPCHLGPRSAADCPSGTHVSGCRDLCLCPSLGPSVGCPSPQGCQRLTGQLPLDLATVQWLWSPLAVVCVPKIQSCSAYNVPQQKAHLSANHHSPTRLPAMDVEMDHVTQRDLQGSPGLLRPGF